MELKNILIFSSVLQINAEFISEVLEVLQTNYGSLTLILLPHIFGNFKTTITF